MSVVEVLGCRYSAWRDPQQVRDRYDAVREGAGRGGRGHDSRVCGVLRQLGVDLSQRPGVARTVVVNQQNTWARCLTVAELKKIWEPGSRVNNWQDVRAGFPDVPLKLFGPGTDSGTFEFFTEKG